MDEKYTYSKIRGQLTFVDKNVIYINSDALDRVFKSRKQSSIWMRKSIGDRLAVSPYKEQIMKVINQYPDFQISEFCTPVGGSL